MKSESNECKLCPYCGIAFSMSGVSVQHQGLNFGRGPQPKPPLRVPGALERPWSHLSIASHLCPACDGRIIWLVEMGNLASEGVGLSKSMTLLWPRNPIYMVPSEVPDPLACDYREAHGTLPVSPKASAALSRRCLQAVLHDRFSIRRANLQQEIQEFVSALGPPTHLAQQLDAVRVVGNFAAHPTKDTNTGEVTEVEDGEAELLLETVAGLFDFAFVQPAKWAAVKIAINAKLRAAGKPELP